jgi:hypothetical protein
MCGGFASEVRSKTFTKEVLRKSNGTLKKGVRLNVAICCYNNNIRLKA